MLKVLGIETSCDETAAAVVDESRTILSHVVLSQVKEHQPYGGVVPEIAARAHVMHLEPLVKKALADANLSLNEVDAISVTGGPGLIGGVMVGVMLAKGLAAASGKPLIAVNHLEGHALTARLTDDVQFPFLLLLVSGGHCQLLSVEGLGTYKRLGTTMDDALGEAFDKVAKLLGLGYPGGPAVERMAKNGNPNRFKLPCPLQGREGCDFSFSGLKTAVLQLTESLREKEGNTLSDATIADICASFQKTCGDSVEDRVKNAFKMFAKGRKTPHTLVVAGGVAANQYLRGRLESLCGKHGFQLVAPPIRLCTDNAAMIAWTGVEYLKAGHTTSLDFAPRARWPLDAAAGGTR